VGADRRELRAVWSAATVFGVSCGAALIKRIILTGLRRQECAALQIIWVEPDRVTLPATGVGSAKQVEGVVGSLPIKHLRQAGALLDSTARLGHAHLESAAVTQADADGLVRKAPDSLR
jgi:hypothetical protein